MPLAERIAKEIFVVAQKEDAILLDIADEGIFHMPELAFVYECGKKIMEKKDAIFGNGSIKWIREKNLGNGGPTDLVFELSNDYKVALEFKLRDTSDAYINDVKKLDKLNNGKTLRLFCALTDVFDKDLPDDGRQSAVANCKRNGGIKVKLVDRKIFSTKQNCYVRPVSCVVAVWIVG